MICLHAIEAARQFQRNAPAAEEGASDRLPSGEYLRLLRERLVSEALAGDRAARKWTNGRRGANKQRDPIQP